MGTPAAMSCPICSSNDLRELTERGTILRCSQCTLAFQKTPPAELSAIYTRDSYDERRRRSAGVPVWSRYHHDLSVARNRLRRLVQTDLPRPNKIHYWTDYGCGNGAFLSAAYLADWRVRGIESDPFFCQEVNGQLGFRIYDAATFLTTPSAYTSKVVSFFDVLEHLVSPVIALKRVAECLDRDGAIVIEVPDLAQHDGAITNWKHLKPDEHLFHFSPVALNALREIHLSDFELINEVEPVPGKLEVVWQKKRD